MRRTSIVAGMAMVALALPAQAGAATNVGETFTPVPSCGFPSETFIQSTSPTTRSYVVPSAGVITSWSWGAGVNAPSQVRLKLATPAGGNNFTIVRQSPARNGPTPNTVETYNARERVAGGELLGVHTLGGDCARMAMAPAQFHHVAGDQAPGSTTAYIAVLSNDQIPVSAVLEPDADNDGYGDETQDCAPTDPSRAEDCNPPDTTISKGPKKKTKKKTATFDFTGTEPLRAIARLECSLDNTEFVPCTSPLTVKVKKGKHTFSVRAADEFNNVDATPATYSWKVKKKKKKKK